MTFSTDLGPEVPPEINPGAEWLIVGEAPGENEVLMKRPFVGHSGKFLDGALGVAKLRRSQFNIVNVVPWRPPGNKIDLWFPKGKPNETVQVGVEKLHAFIRSTRPKAIIALGNTALWALTGHRGITDRRGSVYPFRFEPAWPQQLGVHPVGDCFLSVAVEGDQSAGSGGVDQRECGAVTVPVLAALHPAAVLREPTLANLFARDIQRFLLVIRGDLTHEEPKRKLVLFPSDADLMEAWERVQKAEWVAVDIETGGGKLQCVGFAPEPGWSICIPVDTPIRHAFVEQMLRLDTPKIFHNAPYDVPYLTHKCNLEVRGQIHDTLAMAQALHPELPRDLGTLTSLYTLQPYYKDLGVIWKETSDYATYWKYNALDCAVTREIAHVLRSKLQQYNLWSVYERTQEVLPHAIRMAIRGVAYDPDAASRLRTSTERSAERFQRILDGRAGRAVNVNSNPQITKLLYEDLRLPTRKKRGSNSLAGDQRTILSLYPAVTDRRARQTLRAILGVRHARKFVESYLSVPASADGRMRSSFNPAGTETGRWSASKYLITEGVNLQTVTSRWKPCFRADPGKILFNADYSQIEARLVSYLADDARSIEIFETGGDIHKENAAVIFGKPVDQITAKERDIGKTVHALNYAVGADTLMETVNKRALDTGVWLSRDMAKYVRKIYLERFDRVVRWQEKTWETVQKTRELTNPFGRRRIFLGPTAGPGAEHTMKEALAFVPQSTVPDLLNQALIELSINPPCPGFEVLLNIHDALFGQGPEETMEIWLPAIIRAMQRPFQIGTRSITVPVDLAVGSSWGAMRKLPRRG